MLSFSVCVCVCVCVSIMCVCRIGGKNGKGVRLRQIRPFSDVCVHSSSCIEALLAKEAPLMISSLRYLGINV